MFFSIVIPTYNREDYIVRAVDSVLAQTYADYEVIIVDDGSKDRTAQVVEQHYGTDARVRYIQSVNMGACAARNIGISLAEGKWISLLDSDDYYYPNRLEAVRDVLADHDYDLNTVVYCANARRFQSGRDTSHVTPVEKHTIHERNYIGGCTVLTASKRALMAIDGFDIRLKARQDLDLFTRLIDNCHFVAINEPLCFIELDNTDNISKNLPNKLDGNLAYYKKHSGRMDKRQKLMAHWNIIKLAIKTRDLPTLTKFSSLYLYNYSTKRLD